MRFFFAKYFYLCTVIDRTLIVRKRTLPLQRLKTVLKKAASAETSFTPRLWTKENPLQGHCLVAAFVVQDFFGGTLRQGRLSPRWAKKLGFKTHCWNMLAANTQTIDLSKEQFPADFPYDIFIRTSMGSSGRTISRPRLLKIQSVRKRYLLLRSRVDFLLN